MTTVKNALGFLLCPVYSFFSLQTLHFLLLYSCTASQAVHLALTQLVQATLHVWVWPADAQHCCQC